MQTELGYNSSGASINLVPCSCGERFILKDETPNCGRRIHKISARARQLAV